ncbi:MAG TPA: hypothetical protein VGR21_09295, partial [Cryptosporangiaceae bacterium]|nr:hypothetical protein [Cryptosporangiaceae bacterium]
MTRLVTTASCPITTVPTSARSRVSASRARIASGVGSGASAGRNDPGHPLEQDVSAAEQGDGQAGDHRVLSDHGLGDLLAQRDESLPRTVP